MARRHYTHRKFMEDMCKATVKMIEARIKRLKEDGCKYLVVNNSEWPGMNFSGLKDMVINELTSKGYRMTYGLGGDHFDVNW